MTITPIECWLNLRRISNKAYRKADAALDKAHEYRELPEKIRPATPRDIVEGAIIWYPRNENDEYDETYWKFIEEVYYPSDDFKAYCAEDGCRYGLDGAFVEVK